MRSTIFLSAFAALAIAAPRPQDIQFDLVDVASDPEIVTPPTDVVVDNIAVLPAASAVHVADASVTDVAQAKQKRSVVYKSVTVIVALNLLALVLAYRGEDGGPFRPSHPY